MNKKLAAAILLTSVSLSGRAQLYDVQRLLTSRFSADPQTRLGASRISPDGRYVGFLSTATNLLATDVRGTWDAYVVSVDNPASRKVINRNLKGRPISLNQNGYSTPPWSLLVSNRSQFAALNTYIKIETEAGPHRGLFVFDRPANRLNAVSATSNGTNIGGAVAIGMAADGSKLLLTARKNDRTDLYLADQSGVSIQLSSPQVAGSVVSAVISSSGQTSLWSMGQNEPFGGRLFIRVGATTQELFPNDAYAYRCLAISDDGTQAILQTDRPFDVTDLDTATDLYRVDLNSKTGVRLPLPFAVSEFNYMVASQNGAWVAVCRRDRVGLISALDATAKEVTPLVPSNTDVREISVSDDGKRIALGYQNFLYDGVGSIQVLDTRSRTTQRMDAGPEKASLQGAVTSGLVSADGNALVCYYDGNDLLSGTGSAIYWKDLETGFLRRLPIDPSIQQSPIAISETGRYILFSSFRYDVKRHISLPFRADLRATEMDWSGDRILLTERGFSSRRQIYLLFAQAGKLVTVSRTADHGVGDDLSFGASISADGSTVAFASSATNLPGGRQPVPYPDDVDPRYTSLYLYDVAKGVPRLLLLNHPNYFQSAFRPRLSADGKRLVYIFVYSSADFVYQRRFLDLATGKERELGGFTETKTLEISPDGEHVMVGYEESDGYGPFILQTSDGKPAPISVSEYDPEYFSTLQFLKEKRGIAAVRAGEVLTAKFKFR